ncbi:MAG: glycosyltransferase family 9 protein [Elusimicrobiota bacterium]
MKILIIRLSSIGDIVLATPLIRCLRTAVLSAQIDFLIKKEYSEILTNNQYISNLKFFENNIFETAKKIKKEKYDFILDIHNNFRTFLFTIFSGTKILRYKNYLLQRFFLVEFGINLYKKKIPVFQRYLKTAELLGVSYDNKGLDFFIDEKIKIKSESVFGGYKNQYVGICPVAVWETKRWQKENFVEIAKRILEKRDCEVLIFGGKNNFQYCEDIKIQIGLKAKNLCGLSLQETANVLKKCKYLITNDTGLMHIADALKVRTISIFGPTVEEFGFYPQVAELSQTTKLPQTATSKIISKRFSCKPCSTKGSNKCPVGDFRCIKNISVEEVYSALI